MLTRILARLTIAVTFVVAGFGALASPAQAQEVVCGSDGQGGQVCFLVVVVTTPGGWSVEVQHQSGGESLRYCHRPASGNYVSCQDIAGWYNAEADCYITRADGREPAESMPGYEEYGDDGVVYSAMCFMGPGVPVDEYNGRPVETYPPRVGIQIVLGPSPEGYGGTPSPLPDLIEEAINSLPMSGADIVMAPDPAGAGLVGLPVWMATTVSEATWGPASRTAGPVGGISVTADAQAQNILWEMGDGGEVTCTDPGTVYDPSYGVSESPTCGYPGYRQPSRSQAGGRYPIVATTTWQITWTATSGAGGDLTVTTGSTASVLINELQVLTRYE